jgi:hypothetical protein
MKVSISGFRAEKHFSTVPQLTHQTSIWYKTFPYSAPPFNNNNKEIETGDD